MAQRDGEARNGDPTIRYSEPHEGPPIAYRDNEVITTGGAEALAIARAYDPSVTIVVEEELGPFTRLSGMSHPVKLVRELRAKGFTAQPNHTNFHHAMGSPVYGSPVYGSRLYSSPAQSGPAYGSPVSGSPVYGSPVYGGPLSATSLTIPAPVNATSPTRPAPVNATSVEATPVNATPVNATPVNATPVNATPVNATPVNATPVNATPVNATPERLSSALPAPAGDVTNLIAERLEPAASNNHIRIFVLDTGLAEDRFRPTVLHPATVTAASPEDVDVPDANGDGFLDPAAGHGTFIAGIIGQIAPGCHVTTHRVLNNFGEGHEWDIAKAIYRLPREDMKRTIISVSFGGYVLERAHVMEWAIREILATGAVVVASAGNDATCRPSYPAALNGVVGVGALGPEGPAAFTNYGPWVDVCAPGVDLLSTFFTGFDGARPGPDGVGKDEYRGWAIWSGTSFAAPVVVGNLARMMLLGAPTAQDAVKRLINTPAGMSIPNLGRVINSL